MSLAVPSPRAFLALVASLLLALSLIGTLTSPVRAAEFTVDSTADTDDATPGDGVCATGDADPVCTLRAAVQEANALAGADIITVPAGTYVLSQEGIDDNAGEGDLDLTDDVTITGAGAASTIIDGNRLNTPDTFDRVFDVQDGADATISGVTVQNGQWSGNGGAVRVLEGATLLMTNSVVKDSVAGDKAGGIYVHSSSVVELTNVTVQDNLALFGGGIYNNSDGPEPATGSPDPGPGLEIVNSTITGNRAEEPPEGPGGLGGGIFNDDEASIVGTIISDNEAEVSGGGIYNDVDTTNSGQLADLVLNGDSVITGNVAEEGQGGGVYNVANVDLTNSTVSGNSSFSEGGGLHNEAGSMTVSGSIISGNSSFSGAGLFSEGQAEITNSTICCDNLAEGQGGGIHSTGPLSISSSTINGNGAVAGGGIIFVSGAASGVTIVNSTVSGNFGGDGPAGIVAIIEGAGVVGIHLVTVTGNSAQGGVGAGIHASVEQGGSLAIGHTIVAGNDVNDCHITGTATSGGANIAGDDTCPFDNAALGDLNETDPLLGPLADNGGPTETHALLAGSPAIDRGLAVCGATTDQRGMPRPTDGDGNGIALCDSGAYEAAAKAPPAASINDVSVTEGNSGTVDAVFTVTLSAASSGTVTMAYATADGTATTPADYLTAAGTVTFTPGDTSETITVKVVGDTLDEPNETFFVNLTAPVGATLADAQGTGTILDDDGAPAPVTPTPTPTPAQQVLADTTVAPSRSPAAWIGFAMAVLLLMGVCFSALGLKRRAGTGQR